MGRVGDRWVGGDRHGGTKERKRDLVRESGVGVELSRYDTEPHRDGGN
jgi:hypothetical protein